MKMVKTLSLLDLYVAAYLLLHDIEPKLEMTNGKVSFLFESSDRVYRLMNEYNLNEKVPVADFVTTVKTLRGKMLSMKQSIAENGKGEISNGRQRQP